MTSESNKPVPVSNDDNRDNIEHVVEVTCHFCKTSKLRLPLSDPEAFNTMPMAERMDAMEHALRETGWTVIGAAPFRRVQCKDCAAQIVKPKDLPPFDCGEVCAACGNGQAFSTNAEPGKHESLRIKLRWCAAFDRPVCANAAVPHIHHTCGVCGFDWVSLTHAATQTKEGA